MGCTTAAYLQSAREREEKFREKAKKGVALFVNDSVELFLVQILPNCKKTCLFDDALLPRNIWLSKTN